MTTWLSSYEQVILKSHKRGTLDTSASFAQHNK